MNPYNLEITPAAPTVFENQDTTLTCRATGKPAPTLSWHRIEDMATVLSNNAIDYTITTSETPATGNETVVESQLTILSADNMDLGNYSCKATNKLTQEFTFKKLDVYCKFSLLSYWAPGYYYYLPMNALCFLHPPSLINA